jgi:hypothetical protein
MGVEDFAEGLTGWTAPTGFEPDCEVAGFDAALLGPSFGGAFLTVPAEAALPVLLAVVETGFTAGAFD